MELSKYCKYTTSRIDPASLNVDNYISTENMMQNKGGVTAASKVPTEKAVEYKPGDILISNIRPYFKKIWLADRSGGCSSDVLCIRALKGTDSIYLYYLLSQDSFFDYVMSGAKGSKMPRGDKSQIMKWDVDLPGIDEQRRIGQALKIIDDKIAINNRINHNLEEQADCLISSAIETQSIGSVHLWDICSYVTERVNCDTLNNENYISTDNMFANRGGVGIASTIPVGRCTSFKARDVLISNIRPYFKKIWRASFSGGCSNDVLCFRTTTGTSSFLYHLLRSDVFFEYVMSGAKGSKMPRGDKQHILNWVIPAFEKEIIASLEGSLEVIDDRVAIIQEENRRLSAIRDSLLPLLMNNGIRFIDLTC